MRQIISKHKVLILIFLLGLIIRFLYFPTNTYFGFDQARDAFIAKKIISGDPQLIGPSTSYGEVGLYHGVLYYYIITPIYFITSGNPFLLSAFLRIFNVFGVILIYFTVKAIFSSKSFDGSLVEKIGLLSALFFAISFEQSQFSLYMGNPSLASLSVMLTFLGLALTVFQKKGLGLTLAAVALGASMQLELTLTYLLVPVLIILAVNFKELKKVHFKYWIFALFGFLFSIASFIIAELKFNFRGVNGLLSIFGLQTNKDLIAIVSHFLNTVLKMISFNLSGQFFPGIIPGLTLLIAVIIIAKKFKDFRKPILFLSIWFFGLFFFYLIAGGRTVGESFYFYDVGVSSVLIILTALILGFLFDRPGFFRKISYLILALIISANLNFILSKNSSGTMPVITPQERMLLSDELKIIDMIYADAKGEDFAIKAISIPLDINTTWSYLFEWYGKNKYGFLPIWGNKNAPGYPGNLKVVDAQDALPKKRYLIIEPLYGVPQYFIDEYLRVEGYFTDIGWEKEIGSFKLQKRIPK